MFSYNKYSTVEHFTGKYWIDGRPIYKKTWYNYTIQHNSVLMTNISDIVNQYGMVNYSGDIWLPFPRDAGSSFISLRLNSSNRNAFFDSDGTHIGRFTVEYTKTV